MADEARCTVNVTIHPWCRDVQRDEAVREYEDGREESLPTLAQAISRAGQFVPSEPPQGAKCTERDSVTNRRPVEPGGGENVTPFAEQGLGINESVRVVEEAAIDPGWAERLAAELDAAIRERDTAKADAGKSVLMIKLQAENVIYFRAERDEARRERDELRTEAEKATALAKGLEEKRAYFRQSRDDARAECERLALRVAELESQLESVACRAATAENRAAELESARERFDTALEEARTRSGINDFIVQRDEALEELETAIREREEWRRSFVHSEKVWTRLLAERNAALDDADALRARVAELESAAKLAPPANADGGSNHAAPAASGAAGTEPDAWGVRRSGGIDAVAHRLFRSSAEQSAEQNGGTVVPLYAAPPPASGWLTAEERSSIQHAANLAKANWSYRFSQELENILARSTPPEVVLEDFPRDAVRNLDAKYLAGWDQCMALAKRAIRAAGVTCKEVNCE